MHRWVLLKNSIIRDDYSASNPAYSTVSDNQDIDTADDDDVDSTMDLEEDSYIAFLFPDPGYASSPSATPDLDLSKDSGEMSEAQWLDSLLEKLGDDEDDEDVDLVVQSTSGTALDEQLSFSTSEPSSPTLSFNEDLDISPPNEGISRFVPYPVPYPPFHPPLLFECDFDSLHEYYHSSQQPSNSPCNPYHDIDDPYFSTMPDTIEDCSDDESDSLATPFSRSRSSLHLSLDAPSTGPVSVPLPPDNSSTGKPRHQSSSALDARTAMKTDGEGQSPFYSYEVDPLPYPDMESDSAVVAPFYGPYQLC